MAQVQKAKRQQLRLIRRHRLPCSRCMEMTIHSRITSKEDQTVTYRCVACGQRIIDNVPEGITV